MCSVLLALLVKKLSVFFSTSRQFVYLLVNTTKITYSLADSIGFFVTHLILD